MTGLTEKELLIAMERVTAAIENEETLFKQRTKPLKDELREFNSLYSEAYSPLKPGDKIKYTPDPHSPSGVVKIVKAWCILPPEQWEYQVHVVSVGGSETHQAVGNAMTIKINRSVTPETIK